MDKMVKDAVRSGSSVVESALLYNHMYDYGKWHRSKERKGGNNPFGGYLMNKKWTLEEEFNNHILKFQQVIFI